MAEDLLLFAVCVLALGLVVAPLALIGGTFWWVARGRLRLQHKWRSVGEGLGLQVAGNTMRGHRHGQRVSVWRDGSKRGLTVRAQLDTPLDMGLKARSEDPFVRLSGGIQHRLEFRDLFRIDADEPQRAALLFDTRLQKLMQAQFSSGVTLLVDDFGVVLSRRGGDVSAAWIGWALEAAARATAVIQQRQRQRQLPAAWVLRSQAQAWRAYAADHQLQLTTTPLSLRGRIEGHAMHAHAARTAKQQYQLDVGIGFTRPLSVGLQLQPHGLLDRLPLFVGDDEEFDDPPFDAAFRVRLGDIERGRRILDDGVRAQLLALQQRLGPVYLSDDAIAVRMPRVPADPSRVPQLANQLLELCERISQLAADRQLGPYR